MALRLRPLVAALTLWSGAAVLGPVPASASPVPGAPAPAARPGEIEAVSFVARADGPGVMVRIHASGPVERFNVETERGRVEVTLDGAHVAAHVRQERAAPPVRRYTVAGRGDRVTVRLDVAGTVRADAYREPRSNDLVVTLTAATDGDAPTARAPSPGTGAGGAATTWGAPAPAQADPRPSPAASAPVTSAPQRTVSWGGVTARPAPAPSPAPSPARAESPPASDAPAVAVRPQPAPVRRTAPTPRRSRPDRAPAPTPAPTPIPQAATQRDPSPTVAERPAPTERPRPADPAPEEAPTVAPGNAAWRLDTIVLDAGHGDHDIGATYNGVREKDVTLAITRRLGDLIEREMPGVRVVYTRRGDQFHELRERGRIANRAGGKLFISVHANAAGSPSARGTETYFLAPHRTEAAAEVMERENSVIALESDPSLYAEFHGQDAIVQAMAMSAFQESSQALAALIEGEFRGIGRHSRGVKQAGFLVLWAASMPAVLVETGFISNPDEARYLSSPTGQDETARAIFRSVLAYREQYERGAAQ